MRAIGLLLSVVLIAGCSTQAGRQPDPVRDSFRDFVAAAEKRAKGMEGGTRRIRFGSGRGYTPAGTDSPATGTVSIHIEGQTVVRKILREEPALSFEDFDFTFEYKNGKWELKTGTVRRRLTEATITSGRKPNEIEPERTASFDSLSSEFQDMFFSSDMKKHKEERGENKER